MQEHFGNSMNLARIKLMESNMRRVQRFLASYALDFDLIARMIFSLLPKLQILICYNRP